MGISPFHASSCSCPTPAPAPASAPAPTGQPNPRRFRIARLQAEGFWTVIEAIYDGVTNYEGRKIIVYAYPEKIIRSRAALDPHFCDSVHHVSPFARFEPTRAGWAAAVELAELMNERFKPSPKNQTIWERLMADEPV